MHELSITRNIVAIVAEHASGRRVTRVRLLLGELSAVMPDAIRFCFDLCIADTPLAGARLEIDQIEGRGRCTACGQETALHMPAGRCPACGLGALLIIAGQDMKIQEFEFETEETPSCA